MRGLPGMDLLRLWWCLSAHRPVWLFCFDSESQMLSPKSLLGGVLSSCHASGCVIDNSEAFQVDA